MAFLRALALIILLVAVIALASDVTRATTGGAFVSTSVLSYWKTSAPQSLAAVTGFVQKSLHPALWDPVLTRLLLLPAWFTLGAIGLMFAVLGRAKRRVNIFSN